MIQLVDIQQKKATTEVTAFCDSEAITTTFVIR